MLIVVLCQRRKIYFEINVSHGLVNFSFYLPSLKYSLSNMGTNMVMLGSMLLTHCFVHLIVLSFDWKWSFIKLTFLHRLKPRAPKFQSSLDQDQNLHPDNLTSFFLLSYLLLASHIWAKYLYVVIILTVNWQEFHR